MSQTLEKTDSKELFVAEFERILSNSGGNGQSALSALRREAIDRFVELGFPTARDEAWRQTNLSWVAKTPLRPAPESQAGPEAERLAGGASFPELDCHRMVFVNGRFASRLSSIGQVPKGAKIESLAEALRSHPGPADAFLTRVASFKSHAFIALNTALFEDGAFVNVPDGVTLEKPVHLVFVSTGASEPTVSHPRNLLLFGKGCRASIVESYVGPADAAYLCNPVTELAAGEESVVDHYKVQQEGLQGRHVATLQARVSARANFMSHAILLGSAMTRNEVNAYLDGENIECVLDGLYMGTGRQHLDTHTRLDHAKPHCNSYELYKGILDGSASAVFCGRIHVHPDAQKTDALQSNSCLLLSDTATIHTQPQLEIFADDVKCTHGATVGQLEEDAVFYLRSRGIPEKDARAMLIYAFANEAVGRVKIDPLRNRLEQYIADRFK